ncbi:N-acetylmuramic acid/N-acetylglucosamine kinase [Brevibacillus reuszeri]|uniref:N-acetylglucosamine kinase n=1 Tax=Brevibacillus reuszeri TaxID=54915 RepID=A0A0K9YYK4_9BACL|nr:BadF/BadG/BcrA/BcrD ATPase family protein [Brevibacillus reuszeri]KNB73315.1 N-acetylglucosamine kinase [Brevibacillus reuszeri]MED1856935.1 BadF/BadG/BcrA/BcrD ATPase family protein [Brevibacillus reuszeri]GED68316.1 N-acetylmuramic acid/N-acetylglucosamine kinase [Brevibacillus reuszeri]
MRSSNEKKWFIGIDGGGTKTKAAICDRAGRVMAVEVGEGSNPLSRPWEEVEHTLRTCMNQVQQQAGAKQEDVAGLYIGLGGAEHQPIKELLRSAFNDPWQGRLFIDNDAIAALYAGTWGEPGIVLICGTGSIAYALTEQGERHRVGGWGYLVGDEGSGFDLGKKAAIAVLRAHDGRGEQTMLTELFLTHYKVQQPNELISLIYNAANPRMGLAQASGLVESAAASGDTIASQLISDAADSLIELATTCLRKTKESLPVVLAGGLLTAKTMLCQELKQKAPFATVVPSVSPVIGSLVAAMVRSGNGLDEGIKSQLLTSGTELEKG